MGVLQQNIHKAQLCEKLVWARKNTTQELIKVHQILGKLQYLKQTIDPREAT